MNLSVLCPAIRSERWLDLYKSIDESFSGSWEFILITEKNIPRELGYYKKDHPNMEFMYSQRAPLHKQQEALSYAKGDWILNISDDQIYIKGALDKAFEKAKDYKTIVVMKYLEGQEFEYPDWHRTVYPYKTNHDFMKSDQYYFSGTHVSSQYRHIPMDTPILSCCFISKKVLLEVGGWDCAFYTQAIGNVDLAVRLMKHGCNYVIHPDVVETCGHMPGIEGDHSALHYAQTEQDEPLLQSIYGGETCDRQTIIDINNWKHTESIWKGKV